jgi:hypothetical protein
MNPYIIIPFCFFLQLNPICFAQQQNNVFKVKIDQTSEINKYVFYSDIDDAKCQKVPEFNVKGDLSAIIIKKLPIKELSRIEKEIFSEEELKSAGRLLITFKIHIPTGKIAAVSFSTKNNDMDIGKLMLYNQRIKDEVIFDITLKADLIEDGYDRMSYRLFFSSYKL